MILRLVLILPLLTACVQFPDIDRAVPDEIETGPYPKIVPASQTPALTEPRLDAESDDALEARAQRLRNRAQALQ